MSLNNTTRSNTSGVLSSTAVGNSIDDDLDRVLTGQEMNDVEGLLDNTDGLELLAVVSALSHHGVGESFDDGAGDLLELLSLVFAGSVGQPYLGLGRLDVDVGDERGVLALDAFVRPLSEQFWFDGECLVINGSCCKGVREADSN